MALSREGAGGPPGAAPPPEPPPRAAADRLTRNMVILACAVDAADKQLLPASFKAIDEQLHLGPSRLAAMSFAQSITYSLSLPLWGALLRNYPARTLLMTGCFLWSFATYLQAAVTTYSMQVLLRGLVGVALASVSPVAQAMLCDAVPEDERGYAFGLMQSFSALTSMAVSFGTTCIASMEIGGIRGWRVAHVVVATLSACLGLGIRWLLEPKPPAPAGDDSWLAAQRRVVAKIASRPTFVIMVLQGVTGGIPWNGLTFLTFYWQISGFSPVQAAEISLFTNMGGIVAGVLGGVLGDHFAKAFGTSGRCAVAQASVFLGTVAFLCLVNFGEYGFFTACVVGFLFQTLSGWTVAGALQPMCGELFNSGHERAQVLALWNALEGIISSFCGAPVVGMVSELCGYKLSAGSGGALSSRQAAHNRDAFRLALEAVAVLPWTLCFVAWVPMYWTYPYDLARGRARADQWEAVPAAEDAPHRHLVDSGSGADYHKFAFE